MDMKVLHLVRGLPGCLAGDTELIYLRGKRVSGRKISIKSLYEKFNNLTSHRPWLVSGPTKTHALTSDGVLRYSEIVAVVESGIKPLLILEFSDGLPLKLTAEHLVMTPNGFVKAGVLATGDEVIARGSNKPQAIGRKPRPDRKIVTLKYHKYGATKLVAGKYRYTRVPKSRLLLEAEANNMAYEDYIHTLQTDQSCVGKLRFIPYGFEAHHIDENPLNDVLSNLYVMTTSEHGKHHSFTENFNTWSSKIVVLKSKRELPAQMTYDIVMSDPDRNFCANGIVVHNSGKTTLARTLALNGLHAEADNFFEDQHGRYNWIGKLVPDAHLDCKHRAEHAMRTGVTPVVIANTFVRRAYMTEYEQMAAQYGYQVEYHDLGDGGLTDGELLARNVHAVPLVTIEKMRAAYEF